MGVEIVVIVVGVVVALLGAGGLLFKRRSPKPPARPPKEIDRYVDEEIERITKEKDVVIEELRNDSGLLRLRAQQLIDELRARRDGEPDDGSD